MKRTPLIRRTAMVRTGRLVRTAIAPISTKRVKENRVRRRNLHDAYGDNPTCFIPGCGRPAVDGHELLSRARGGSITDPENVRPVCRECHTRITENPSWAEGLYFALPSPPRKAARDSGGYLPAERELK